MFWLITINWSSCYILPKSDTFSVRQFSSECQPLPLQWLYFRVGHSTYKFICLLSQSQSIMLFTGGKILDSHLDIPITVTFVRSVGLVIPFGCYQYLGWILPIPIQKEGILGGCWYWIHLISPILVAKYLIHVCFFNHYIGCIWQTCHSPRQANFYMSQHELSMNFFQSWKESCHMQ